MDVAVVCSSCQKRYRVDERLGGKRVKCKACNQTFVIPIAAGSAVTTKATAPAQTAAAATGAARGAMPPAPSPKPRQAPPPVHSIPAPPPVQPTFAPPQAMPLPGQQAAPVPSRAGMRTCPPHESKAALSFEKSFLRNGYLVHLILVVFFAASPWIAALQFSAFPRQKVLLMSVLLGLWVFISEFLLVAAGFGAIHLAAKIRSLALPEGTLLRTISTFAPGVLLAFLVFYIVSTKSITMEVSPTVGLLLSTFMAAGVIFLMANFFSLRFFFRMRTPDALISFALLGPVSIICCAVSFGLLVVFTTVADRAR